MQQSIDPVCLIHGKKKSEHLCLYCCLCYKSLTPDECNVLEDGKKEDVCKPCAAREQARMEEIGLAEDGTPIVMMNPPTDCQGRRL